MTIKDIARLAGCGVATVSRVLNGQPDVSPRTRERVLAVVAEHDFRPNSNARRLKQRADTAVPVLVQGTQNLLFADLVERVQAHLRDHGRQAALYYLDEDADGAAFAARLCRERRPAGILFLGGTARALHAPLAAVTAPCVLLTGSARELGFDNLSSLTTDDEAAAFQAASYLLDRGHRAIGVLGGSRPLTQIGLRRLAGLERAFGSRGLTFDLDRRWEPCRYDLEGGYEAARRLMERCPELTALFTMSDVTAIGAIRALGDLGLRVPEDVSVMGYDGIPMARYCVPRLTTICQDTGLMARRGVELLLERMDRGGPPVYETAPFRLQEGESVADLRQSGKRGS